MKGFVFSVDVWEYKGEVFRRDIKGIDFSVEVRVYMLG